jgi:hypothetical protein
MYNLKWRLLKKYRRIYLCFIQCYKQGTFEISRFRDSRSVSFRHGRGSRYPTLVQTQYLRLIARQNLTPNATQINISLEELVIFSRTIAPRTHVTI